MTGDPSGGGGALALGPGRPPAAAGTTPPPGAVHDVGPVDLGAGHDDIHAKPRPPPPPARPRCRQCRPSSMTSSRAGARPSALTYRVGRSPSCRAWPTCSVQDAINAQIPAEVPPPSSTTSWARPTTSPPSDRSTDQSQRAQGGVPGGPASTMVWAACGGTPARTLQARPTPGRSATFNFDLRNGEDGWPSPTSSRPARPTWPKLSELSRQPPAAQPPGDLPDFSCPAPSPPRRTSPLDVTERIWSITFDQVPGRRRARPGRPT